MSISARRTMKSPDPMWFDGRFTTPGTYNHPDGSSGSNVPLPPYLVSEYQGGVNSKIVVYSNSTKQQAWWPNVQMSRGSSYAAAYMSYSDGVVTPTRSQTRGYVLQEGSEFYFGYTVYIPNVPEQPNYWSTPGSDNDWNVISQVHSAPYTTSPAVSVSVQNISGQICLTGQSGTGWATWVAPISFNTWIHVVQHIRVSIYPSIAPYTDNRGLLETWVNGVKQTQILPRPWANHNTAGQSLSADSKTAYVATEVADTNGPGTLYINNYRNGTSNRFSANDINTVALFHGDFKVGSSYSSVSFDT